MSRRRSAPAAVLLALVVAAAACGGDDGGAASPGGDTTAATGAPGTDTTTPAGGGEEASGSANPCDAVTQQQWEAIFGAGVTKSDASGTADSCKVLTSGSSPGHELALTNLSMSGTASFDEALATYRGCSGEPTELDLGERAVADGSCLGLSGKATVIVQDGDILLVTLNLGEPALDPEGVLAAFTEAATAVVSAR